MTAGTHPARNGAGGQGLRQQARHHAHPGDGGEEPEGRLPRTARTPSSGRAARVRVPGRRRKGAEEDQCGEDESDDVDEQRGPDADVSVTAAPPRMPATWAAWLIVPPRARSGPRSSFATDSPSSADWTPRKAVRQAPRSGAAISAATRVGNRATAP